MGSYTTLAIDSITFNWKYHIPPFVALLFEHQDFFYEEAPHEDLEGDSANESECSSVGYRSTVLTCKARLDQHGYTLPFIADIYSLFREELAATAEERISWWFPSPEAEMVVDEPRRFASAIIGKPEPATAIQELETYIDWLRAFVTNATHKNFVRKSYANYNSYYEWLYEHIDDNTLRLHPSVTKVGSLIGEEYLLDCPEIVEVIHCRLLLEAMEDTVPVVLETADILGSYMQSMNRDSCEAELRRLLLSLPIDLMTKADRYDKFVRMLKDKEASWHGRFSKLQVRAWLKLSSRSQAAE